MKLSVVDWLRCPACGGSLDAAATTQNEEDVPAGKLQCSLCGVSYPIVRSVPRFVDSDSYADAFSFEWNVHRTTQVDSQTGKTDSEDRLRKSLGFPLAELHG